MAKLFHPDSVFRWNDFACEFSTKMAATFFLFFTGILHLKMT
jgi:hypothetical protein